MSEFKIGQFGYDKDFLSGKSKIVILQTKDGQSQLIASPDYQGKVFTSTVSGLDGKSLGFVNYKALSSTTIDPHMNAYGGENRLWLGPEGGRYSIFFRPDVQQIADNWHTPEFMDTEAWDILSVSQQKVLFAKQAEVSNYRGTKFKLALNRQIEILSMDKVENSLQINLPDNLNSVAYSTDNILTNQNRFEWTVDTGTVCMWLLDMFPPSEKAITVIPYNQGNDEELGVIVKCDYFGSVPTDRLKLDKKNVYLKTDGKFRSKIGLNKNRTKAISANYDAESHHLIIITFQVDENGEYLNQCWDINENPWEGDAFNAYNDGPMEDGKIMGPFLELESCSSAAFLKPNEILSHKHNVYHFVGNEDDLSVITQQLLDVSIEEIKSKF